MSYARKQTVGRLISENKIQTPRLLENCSTLGTATDDVRVYEILNFFFYGRLMQNTFLRRRLYIRRAKKKKNKSKNIISILAATRVHGVKR